MAPQRRKQIQQYMLSGERLVHIKDYSIPEPAQIMVGYISAYKQICTCIYTACVCMCMHPCVCVCVCVCVHPCVCDVTTCIYTYVCSTGKGW